MKAISKKLVALLLACSFSQVLMGKEPELYANKYNLVIHAYDKKFIVNGKSMKSRESLSAYLQKLHANEYPKILIVKDSLMQQPCCFALGKQMMSMGFKEPEYVQMPIKRNKAVLGKK